MSQIHDEVAFYEEFLLDILADFMQALRRRESHGVPPQLSIDYWQQIEEKRRLIETRRGVVLDQEVVRQVFEVLHGTVTGTEA